jgi:hypothetical protein
MAVPVYAGLGQFADAPTSIDCSHQFGVFGVEGSPDADHASLETQTNGPGAALKVVASAGVARAATIWAYGPNAVALDATANSTEELAVVAQAKIAAGTGMGVDASGTQVGVRGTSNNDGAFGVQGHSMGNGGTVGVYGLVNSPAGIAVLGCGQQYGVSGYAADPNGYAVHAMGNLRCDGNATVNTLDCEGKATINTIQPPAAEPADADIPVGCMTFTIDEQQDKLKVKIKFSDGTLRWGIVQLTPVRPA